MAGTFVICTATLSLQLHDERYLHSLLRARGTTSLGWDAVYGVVAVNPSIIPYGTKMYITSPDGSVVYGYGVAGDTGGAAMAGDILADLCYNTLEECSQIGRRTMNIYILS